MNAVKDGMHSHRLLLPGEDPVEFDEFRRINSESLGPGSAIEEELKALIIGTLWKLRRLERIEHRRQLGHLEAELAKTAEWMKLATVQRAHSAVSALVSITKDMPTPPTELAALAGLVSAMHTTSGLVGEVEDLPNAIVGAFEKSVEGLRDSADGKVNVAAYAQVGVIAHEVLFMLTDMLTPSHDAVEAKRAQLAAEVVPLADCDLKKLAKLQALLDETLSRHLDQLRATRELVRSVARRTDELASEVEPTLRAVD